MREQLISEILAYWVWDEGRANNANKDRVPMASSGYQEAQRYIQGLLAMDEESLREELRKQEERVIKVARSSRASSQIMRLARHRLTDD